MDTFRERIDRIDEELIDLFCRRMDLSAQIARYKRQNDLPLHHPERERQILRGLSAKTKKGYEDYVTALYRLIFELSRSEQERIIRSEQEPGDGGGGAVQDKE